MFFRARNGTYKRVGQVPNCFLGGEAGGMTVYYTTPYDGAKSTAFTPVCFLCFLFSFGFFLYFLLLAPAPHDDNTKMFGG